jgi:RNA polymerase sigma factor (sigma-70 family)
VIPSREVPLTRPDRFRSVGDGGNACQFMSRDDQFDDLMARIRAGDDAAETVVFRRFVRQLIALAARQFDVGTRDRIDVEDVVLSAYKSFFLRNNRGDFDLGGWDELWALLAIITLRKCRKRKRFMRARRRDAARERLWPKGADAAGLIPDRAPTPVQAAIFAETVEQLFQATSEHDRPVVEQILAGYTAEEVARRLNCSERTVRRVRQRAKLRLQRLVGPESGPS